MCQPKEPRRTGPDGQPQVNKVPLWLRWALVFFIKTNIVSYVVVTIITVIQLNKQIDALGDDETKVKELQARRTQLIAGTGVEVLIDLIDLFNIFVGSYLVHVCFLFIKMVSVGMWAYTQTTMGHAALWIIPIGLAMVVAIILLEWFYNLRRCALITLVLVATLAWIGIVTMRVLQITADMDKTEEAMAQADKGKQQRFMGYLDAQKSHKLRIIIYSLLMIMLGTFGLLVLCIEKLWIGIMFAFLQLAGIVLWTVKLFTDGIQLDYIFTAPLSYSLLTWAILVCHLVELGNKPSTADKRPQKNRRKLGKERK